MNMSKSRVTHALCGGSIVGALLFGLACSDAAPTGPAFVPSPPPVAQPPTQPPQGLPPGTPVATYAFGGQLDYAVSSTTAGSEYLLYDDGVFGLRYASIAHVYLGKYRQNGDTIVFDFDGSWTWNQGTATGTLTGERMEVRYSEIMQHSDFENAVYRRSR